MNAVLEIFVKPSHQEKLFLGPLEYLLRVKKINLTFVKMDGFLTTAHKKTAEPMTTSPVITN